MSQVSDTVAVPAMKGHRLFAALYDFVIQGAEQKVFGAIRESVAGPARGRVLELGAGTGANFPYYRAAAQIVATEPDPFMLRRGQKRVRELGLDVEFHQAPAEALPFPDSSFDTVVATLVLCTVVDQARSLAEAARVLKPDGALRFIEHVRGGGLTGRVQDTLVPVWRRIGAGCHPNRRTRSSIESAGFEIVDLQQRSLPLMPLIFGVARRRDGEAAAAKPNDHHAPGASITNGTSKS